MHRYDINNDFIMLTGFTPYALAKCCRSGKGCIVSEKLPGVSACPFGCLETLPIRKCSTITEEDWSNRKIREGDVHSWAEEDNG